ncbi:hypothetical protein B5F53_15285 [Blautia sp. An249]|uniref:hypothetical protein n=1 Tax=Blautia sp. An249 TaxID=1965603 RepID=UPI000B39A132|nr:hypothetical protein [Blautia sp. An249]OUO76939.1 hypothetical protein B5F53_15285 [Blautia sp. An249]
MIEIIEQETLEGKIRKIAEHYSRRKQWLQVIEEAKELLKELENAANPFEYEGLVYLPDNTWSEIADVIIMCAQLAMQHGKEDQVRQQLEYKVNRQLERIEQERLRC